MSLLALLTLLAQLRGALAACPGEAAPGTYCEGAVETLCPAGKHCSGGAAPATPCLTPANCAVVGLSAEPGCFWNVTTLAGNGVAAFANGRGTAASFSAPGGVAADASGVVYVADFTGNRIRAVTPSGLVSALAGSGGVGGWADGTGTAAAFFSPQDVATYPGSGIIFVADLGNHRIRKLTPTGVTSTFAGSGSPAWADGQGTFASFSSPSGLTVDSAGAVYVADRDNHRIRKISPLGAVTTYAGNGDGGYYYLNGVGSSAYFLFPADVAVDGSGNVYVADAGNNRIRLILPTRAVSAFAGRGRYNNAWVDGAGSSAEFNYPCHISIAANGDLFVSDRDSNRIRMITPLRRVTTLAGGPSASFLDGYGTASLFSAPAGVTVTPAGTVYVGDSANSRIRVLSCEACPSRYYCSSGIPLLCPAGAFCPYPSSSPQPCPTGTYSPTNGAVSNATCLACPAGAFSPTAGASSFTVCPAGAFCPLGSTTPTPCHPGTYSNSTGAASSAACIPACSPGSFQPFFGAPSNASCLPCLPGYFGTSAGLSEGSCTGACSAAPGSGCAAGSVSPAAKQCAAGYFCPGGAPAPAIPCMTPANCAVVGLSAEPPCVWNVTNLAGSGAAAFANGRGTEASFWGPEGAAADASGLVYVADQMNHRIRAVTPSGLVSTLAGRSGAGGWADGTGASARFNSPSGVAIHPGLGIYVADAYNHRIRSLTPSGVTTTFAGDGFGAPNPGRWADGHGTSASFSFPFGLAVDSAGMVYVGDAFNNRIRKITPLGAVSTLSGTGSDTPFSNGIGTSTVTFYFPTGVAVDGSGNVYVGDSLNSRIRLILPNGTVSTFAGSGSREWADGTGTSAAFYNPRYLSFAASGNLLVADLNNHRIRTITPRGEVTTIAGGPTNSFLDGYGSTSLFNSPAGVAVTSGGTIYIGDSANNRIRALSCVPCPSGYFCSTNIPLLCPAGAFCPFRSISPTLCSAGTYSSAIGAVSSATCLACPAGYSSPTAGASSSATCLTCPAGYFCPLSSSNPTPCSPGTYNAQTGRTTSCSSCPANQYTPSAGQTFCFPCASGQFSTPGSVICWSPGSYNTNSSSSPTKCPTNTYSNISAATLLSDCLRCPAGFTSAAGVTSCFSTSGGCPAGTFTASTAPLTCEACETGTFSPAAASTCTPCEAGFFSGAGSTTCARCPQGSYCPSGVETPCPKGMYGIVPGGTDLYLACSSCPPGTFQPSLRATSIASCASCAAGYFSTFPASPNCTACAPGTANPLVAQTSPDVCTPCASGTFTGLPGQASCTNTCPMGYIGTTAGGTSLSTACAACSPGSYSAFAGSLRCMACPPGQYAEQPGSTYCEDCPSGTFSNTPAATTRASCTPCGAGSYNPAPGQTSSGCIPCAPGKASFAEGASQPSQCISCSAGFYAALGGSANCTLSPAGTFSGPSAASPSLCPLGTFSGAGVSACAACPVGSAASTTGSASCTNCSAGHYADAPGMPSCTPCPTGTFTNLPSSTSPAACQPCPSGTFNPSQGQTSSGCISCPPGTASATPGASALSQCAPCSAGTFASLAGSSSCAVSPAGSFSAPPLSGGGAGATSPTQCPLGTYSGLPGALSVAQCTACPSGRTTASTGATQDSQCLALPYACPPGQQPRLASAASLADCAPLTCPLPLRPSAFAGHGSDAAALAQSLSCLGCASGTSGAVPACAPCTGAAICPGFTSRPLYNFSADAMMRGAASALAQGSGAPASPFSACPALAALTSSVATTTLASAATSTAFFGVPLPTTSSLALLAWLVIFSLLFTLALFVAFSHAAESATGCSALPLRALKSVDLFSMNHRVKDRSSPINEATPLGGLFSLMGLTTLLTYAAYMVAAWLQDSTLVQQSLATMGPSVWGRVAALPWAAPPAASSLGSLALRLIIDGNPGACAVPISITTAGLAKGAFTVQSTADCGGSGISQHTLTCPGCQLTSDTSISLAFDYSCQSMLLEALGTSPAYPGPLALSALAAPPALTAAPKPGALLTSVTWQLTPVLSVLWDNVTASSSAIGWDVADSKLALAPFLTPPALNGSLSILPTASPVTVTFALSLSSTNSATLLTQRVPITQLLANIVGLTGLLAFFGVAFGSFEGYCARKRGVGGAHKQNPPLSSSSGSGGGGGGGSALGGAGMEASSVLTVDNPLRGGGSPATPLREAGQAQGGLAGELQALRQKVEALEAAAGPLQAPRAAAAAVVWQRHSDGSGDVWHTSSAGETAWELPAGAVLQR